jgi:hypothetical protein
MPPFSFSKCPHVLTTLLMATVAVLLAGCGLGDYEALMRQNRNQSKGGDEDRKLLGEPLDLPQVKDGETSSPALTEAFVFLRPPKLFGCKPAPNLVAWDKYAPPVGKGASSVYMPGRDKGERLTQLYFYGGAEGCNVLLAAAVSDWLTLDDQERAVEASEFKRTVWSTFLVYLQQWRLPKGTALPAEPKQKKQEEVVPPRNGKVAPPTLRYEVWIWEEPETQPKVDAKSESARYSLCFYQNDMIQVAVIFQIPRSRASDPAIQKGIEASLKSLGVGPDGAQRRHNASKNK